MPDLLYLESLLAHLNEPADHITDIDGHAVAHREPAVIFPSEDRDVVFIRFRRGLRDREERVRDADVHALVLAVKACGRQVVHARQVRAPVPVDREPCQLRERPLVLSVRSLDLVDIEPRLKR